MVRYSKEEIEKATQELRAILKPGNKVYTILRHVSKSGMSRSISMFVVKKGERLDITYWASRVLEDRIDQKNDGIVITGAGMDMGFSLVYSLGWRLFPKGFKAPKGHWRNEPLKYETDGGYALKQEWA